MKVYVDGKPQALDRRQRQADGDDPDRQAAAPGPAADVDPLQGKLDDVQLYGLELSRPRTPLSWRPGSRSTWPRTAGRPRREADRGPAGPGAPVLPGAGRHDYARLQGELADVVRQKAELEKSVPAVMVMQELPKPRDTFVLERGAVRPAGREGVPPASRRAAAAARGRPGQPARPGELAGRPGTR